MTGLGYDVSRPAASGLEALEMAANTTPDLVLMDIRLSGDMDGVEAAMEIQERHPVPVVFLTAFADDDTVMRVKSVQPSGYLIKPFNLKELKAVIETALFKAGADRPMIRNREKLKAFIDSACSWETWTAPDGDYYYCSPACLDVTGRRSEEFLNDKNFILKITHPLDKDLVKNHLYLHRKLASPSRLEFRILKPGGEERWISHKCQPVYSGDGSWCGVRSSNRDITSQVRVNHERGAVLEKHRRTISGLEQLKKMLPVCTKCKKIRVDSGCWERIEDFILKNADVCFTHGICPDCARRLYPEIFDKD